MKRSFGVAAVLIGVLALTVVSGFSQENEAFPGGDKAGLKPRPPEARSGEQYRDRETGGRRGEMGIVGQLAGVDVIRQKYQIRIQRVFLDAKEKTIDYREKQRILLDRLFELSRGYEADQLNSKTDIIEILEKIRDNRRNIDAVHEASMDRIRALHEEQKKEIERALDAEMKKLSTDNEEMEKFMGMVNEYQSGRRGEHAAQEEEY
jgi:hypothetical protein